MKIVRIVRDSIEIDSFVMHFSARACALMETPEEGRESWEEDTSMPEAAASAEPPPPAPKPALNPSAASFSFSAAAPSWTPGGTLFAAPAAPPPPPPPVEAAAEEDAMMGAGGGGQPEEPLAEATAQLRSLGTTGAKAKAEVVLEEDLDERHVEALTRLALAAAALGCRRSGRLSPARRTTTPRCAQRRARRLLERWALR
jgi:hypothetical protein